jgi:hypothetical protein
MTLIFVCMGQLPNYKKGKGILESGPVERVDE